MDKITKDFWGKSQIVKKDSLDIKIPKPKRFPRRSLKYLFG